MVLSITSCKNDRYVDLEKTVWKASIIEDKNVVINAFLYFENDSLYVWEENIGFLSPSLYFIDNLDKLYEIADKDSMLFGRIIKYENNLLQFRKESINLTYRKSDLSEFFMITGFSF